MRYIVALAVVGMLVAAISMYANYSQGSFRKRFRQHIDAAKQAGALQPDADESTEFGMEVYGSEALRMSRLDTWINYRLFLIPVMIVGSLAIARISERRDSPTTPFKTTPATNDATPAKQD